MPESLFSSLLHSLDKSNISQIASSLGESERGIFRGMESSIASVLGAISSKAEDPNALRSLLDMTPETAGEISWPRLIAGLSTPGASWIVKGKNMLASVFGSNSNAVASAISRECAVGEGTSTALLSMAAPMVLRFLGRRVLDEGWTMSSLGHVLQRESTTIRGALPAGVSDLFWPRAASAAASPVIAQSVQPERSAAPWLGALGLTALALGAFWLLNHWRTPEMPVGSAVTGEASRAVTDATDFVKRKAPDSLNLNLPQDGAEYRLLRVIRGDRTGGWLIFDGLTFGPGSATLKPGSSPQLDKIAAILKAYPNTKISIAGFTDNAGSAESNMALSRARAKAVRDALVSRGIPEDHLITQGYGEDHALASNETAVGRAQNRRVSLEVTQR